MENSTTEIPLQRVPSAAPAAIFTPVLIEDDKDRPDIANMVLFKRTYTQIRRKTDLLHKMIESRYGKPYDNEEEIACVAWTLRALGIINDDSLHLCIDYQREKKIGTTARKIMDIFNNYFGEEIMYIEFVPISTVFAYLPEGCATQISVDYRKSEVSHDILAIKTTQGRKIIYDPSKYREDRRIWWASTLNGEKSRFDTVENELKKKGLKDEVVIYTGSRERKYESNLKLPTQFFGGKSNRKFKKNTNKKKPKKIQTKRKYK
jgi:frataxin-like iron-binding protein CyaY